MLIYDFLFIASQRITIIYQFRLNTHHFCMNIKITIKDADTTPLLMHKKELSEVEFKKKSGLYQHPQRDRNPPRKQKTVVPSAKASRDQKSLRQTGLRSSGQDQIYRQAQKKAMEDLDKLSKNQVGLDMIHNSNTILQKQNEILSQNQKTIQNLVKNSQQKQNNSRNQGTQSVDYVLKQVNREVDQMKKIRDQIIAASKQFSRTLNQTNKQGKQVSFQGVPNITQMNSNLKNLAEVSKNQLQGLQNLEGIKSLQNFNIEGYTQAITGLKKQIVQYQKQSQQIERQLKLRAAKLQKLDITPNFDEQLLVPYQNYLKKKADSIDLHAIKDKMYEKLGHFDYGKFQFDVSQVMAEIRGQMNDFTIVCKQYRVDVPELKLDPKEMKNLDLKLNSAIDQYKAQRGINFNTSSEKTINLNTGQLTQSISKKMRRTGEPIVSRQRDTKKGNSQKIPQAIRQLNTKPIDFSTQVKLQKNGQQQRKTILQNQKQNNKKLVQNNIKKGKLVKQDEDFQKYLEYRKQQQLELLYKQKRQRLQKQKQQLYQECTQPQYYLNLNIRNEVKKENSLQRNKKQEIQKPIIKQKIQINKQKQQEFKQLKPIYGTQGQAIKSIGTEVLRQKLKNLLDKNNNGSNKRLSQNQQNRGRPIYEQSGISMNNMAENFISLINNTLTQVNTQISQTIQNKYQQRSLSKQKKQYQRRSPPKMYIPKLQQFRAPPVFNMQLANNSSMPAGALHLQKQLQAKIISKNYEHLQIKDDMDYADLQISGASYQQDFE